MNNPKLKRLLARPPLLGFPLPATQQEILKLPGIGAKKLAVLRLAGLVKPGFKYWFHNRAQQVAATEALIAKHKSHLAKAEARLAKLTALR